MTQLSFEQSFNTQGYAIQTQLIDPKNCQYLMHNLKKESQLSSGVWPKSAAALYPCFSAIARTDTIVDQVSKLIGDDIILWGATLLSRASRAKHRWHSDLVPNNQQNFVSVWIGLQNTSSTIFNMVAGSQHYGKTIQGLAYERNISRDDANNAQIETWANEFNQNTAITDLHLNNGDAIFFDGNTWHNTINQSQFKKRYALLLQYCTPDSPVRIPKYGYDFWPCLYQQQPRPPCILVRGSTSSQSNLLVAGPSY